MSSARRVFQSIIIPDNAILVLICRRARFQGCMGKGHGGGLRTIYRDMGMASRPFVIPSLQ